MHFWLPTKPKVVSVSITKRFRLGHGNGFSDIWELPNPAGGRLPKPAGGFPSLRAGGFPSLRAGGFPSLRAGGVFYYWHEVLVNIINCVSAQIQFLQKKKGCKVAQIHVMLVIGVDLVLLRPFITKQKLFRTGMVATPKTPRGQPGGKVATP